MATIKQQIQELKQLNLTESDLIADTLAEIKSLLHDPQFIAVSLAASFFLGFLISYFNKKEFEEMIFSATSNVTTIMSLFS